MVRQYQTANYFVSIRINWLVYVLCRCLLNGSLWQWFSFDNGSYVIMVIMW